MFKVYDERTNETLFTSEDKLMCASFIAKTYDESGDDFEHMYIGKVEIENRYGNRAEAGNRINGAAGDGITDDTKAIQKEAAKNENKST